LLGFKVAGLPRRLHSQLLFRASMTGTPGAMVLKVTQHLQGPSGLEVEVRRFRTDESVQFPWVNDLLRDTYGKGWVPKYHDAEDALHTLTAAAFPDFLAQGARRGLVPPVHRLLLLREPARAAPDAPGAWQVLLFTGWRYFDEPQQSMLRAAHAAGERLVRFSFTPTDKRWDYEVDLQELIQRNVCSGVSRKVRLRPPMPDAREVLSGAEAAHIASRFKEEVRKLNAIWLPVLCRGHSRAVVVECRTPGTTLRLTEAGSLDTCGCVGPRAAFLARGFQTPDGRQFVSFRSAVAGGFLRPVAAATTRLECGGDGEGEDCLFELVPGNSSTFSAGRRLSAKGGSTFGCALRLRSTGQFVDINDVGDVVLADPVREDGGEQPAELFVFRYQPKFDEAWKEDSQYCGRRQWVTGSDGGSYTFKEFVDFVHERKFISKPFGETGLVAAKILWAKSAPEEGGVEAAEAARQAEVAMGERRCWSPGHPNTTLYTFADVLAFVEARGLTQKGRTDIEEVLGRWGLGPAKPESVAAPLKL